MDKSNVMEGDTDHDGAVDESDGLTSLFKSFFKGTAENDDKSVSTRNPISGVKKSTHTSAENAKTSENDFAVPSCYKMINDVPAKSRGHLVLIVNKEFQIQKEKEYRYGAETDLMNMKTIAKEMGFDVSEVTSIPQNMHKDDMEKLLEDTRLADHSTCDCFLFMISSHGNMFNTRFMDGGEEHGIITSDFQVVLTRTILEKFNDVNCPTLKDKPKIFIIQACRGDGLDDGVYMNVLGEWKENEVKHRGYNKDSKENNDVHGLEKGKSVPDVKGGKDSWKRTGPPAPSTVVSSKNRITCNNDMLVLYAAPPGKKAWRWVIRDGSWLIHYLYKVIADPRRKRPNNFLKVLTRVALQMSEPATDTIDKNNPETSKIEHHDKKAVSFLEHNLLRPLII